MQSQEVDHKIHGAIANKFIATSKKNAKQMQRDSW